MSPDAREAARKVAATGPDSADGNRPATLRIAAAGDVHCREAGREEVERAFAELAGQTDLVLIAGDLTMHGEPGEAQVLADACRQLDVPVFCVLGNHDWHAGHRDAIVDALTSSGVKVLERGWAICDIGGIEVGIVGTKGFVGGFPGSHLPDFGEPALRHVYAETSAEVEALEQGLREIAVCPVRIVLLHYSPTETTLEGEPPGIWAFLGTDRLAAPIVEHRPDLVLHGHAHAGRHEGAIGDVPVYNVSLPAMKKNFWVLEMSGVRKNLTPIH